MYSGTLLEFLNMGGGEIMIILAVVLLLFGGKKLPELARGLGKGIRDFKDASEGVKREIHRNINSVGIAEDIDSVINDTKSAYHPTEDNNSVKEGISFEKKDVTNEAVNTNSRIETDKTNL
ncbi:MAG: twin-arginine translocase TatA/TatE family subunit [Pedobacter sp.]|nr:MAG: twin-arginine translocase TatA/TatE family subunit [Pedobacter sp.]